MLRPEQDCLGYVKQLNASLHKAQPDFFVATMSIAQRDGRIYVDYNQNLAARNTIAPYSMRGRERPAVATPVTWEELGAYGGPTICGLRPRRSWHGSPNTATWPATYLRRMLHPYLRGLRWRVGRDAHLAPVNPH